MCACSTGGTWWTSESTTKTARLARENLEERVSLLHTVVQRYSVPVAALKGESVAYGSAKV